MSEIQNRQSCAVQIVKPKLNFFSWVILILDKLKKLPFTFLQQRPQQLFRLQRLQFCLGKHEEKSILPSLTFRLDDFQRRHIVHLVRKLYFLCMWSSPFLSLSSWDIVCANQNLTLSNKDVSSYLVVSHYIPVKGTSANSKIHRLQSKQVFCCCVT